MAKFKPGESVEIPCMIAKGAFSNERMVEFETAAGPVSGFVDEENLVITSKDQGFIRGFIESIAADSITVRVHGHFFTTTGIARLSSEWASQHLRKSA